MNAVTLTAPIIDPGYQEWRERALCRQVDGEMFFPDDGEHATDAKRVCAWCEVRAECLADALSLPQQHDLYGIRGGLSPRERAKVRRVSRE